MLGFVSAVLFAGERDDLQTEYKKNFALAYSNACDINAPVFIFAE